MEFCVDLPRYLKYCRYFGDISRNFKLAKDKGISLGRTKCLVPWREQDVGLLAEGKGDVYRPLCMIVGEGLDVKFPKNQPKDAKTVNLEVCSGEGTSGFRSSNRGPLEVESLSDLSFQKFISFMKFVGLPMDGHEKEIAPLPRKLETRKGHKVLVAKRRPCPLSCPALLRSFEIWNVQFINTIQTKKRVVGCVFGVAIG